MQWVFWILEGNADRQLAQIFEMGTAVTRSCHAAVPFNIHHREGAGGSTRPITCLVCKKDTEDLGMRTAIGLASPCSPCDLSRCMNKYAGIAMYFYDMISFLLWTGEVSSNSGAF